ncbi:MAG TPA: histidine phosphatase family protein [Turneriella sp.]|nr:histidine phosphatase family protein [Turneriella sp.]HNA78654.1 histidine phosphatase family protein [Turneriella sp.]HNJ65267.1 histidine phosphatase family protein [Turneriella sp.]HNL11443.1 histidine phosphatase family protein [Turneriella sp.]HNL55428.1 histidine phosphatase family protein [Turneriella sp.]
MAEKQKHIKTLFLLRHAKAEAHDLKKNDHERRLIDKGVRHAEKMAKLVDSFRFKPEAIVTSSAARAEETAAIFADTLGLKQQLTVNDVLYSASQQIYLQTIQQLPDDLDNVMVVGHNPVLEDLLVSLSSRSPFHCKMPTCGLAVVHFHVTLWSEIRPATGIMRVLLYPKLFAE